MNSKVTKGLGIGCSALVLVCVALAGGGIWFASTMKQQFATVRVSEEALVAVHGRPEAWTPPPGLVPTADRMATFVQVRLEMSEWRAHLERSVVRWRAIADNPNPLFRTVQGMRSAGEAGRIMAGFWNTRNEALLAQGMGPGEYAWLYHLVYHAWLGHDPATGVGATDVDLPGGVGVGVSEDQAAARGDVERARRQALREARKLMSTLLENAEVTGEAVTWRDREQQRLADDPGRWPWRSDLPPAFAAVFAPHETELAATWSAAANPLELLFEAAIAAGE